MMNFSERRSIERDLITQTIPDFREENMKRYYFFIMVILFIMMIGCDGDMVIFNDDPPDNDGIKKCTLRILVTTTEGYFVRDARVEIRLYLSADSDYPIIFGGWTDTMGRLGPLHPEVEVPKDTVYVNVTKEGYYPTDTSFRVEEDGQEIDLHFKTQAI
jgi:hypothetical protein